MLKAVSTSENGRRTDANGRLFSYPAADRPAPQNRALAFVFPKRKGGICLYEHPTPSPHTSNHGPGPGRWLYAAFLSASLTPLLSRPAFAAATIWTKASEVMKDVYTQILGISTIVAVVTAAVALITMNFSRSGRTVDESRAWLKRIVITWIILNSLGFIMAYITPFFAGGQWTAP